MPQLLTSAWQFLLDRGPNCLFVRLCPDPQCGCDGSELSERLADLLDQHLANRLVLEMDEVDLLNSLLLGQLVDLSNRVRTQGGMLRLCGLSPANQDVLRTTRLDRRLPHYTDRLGAVHSTVPAKPR
jgi:anti-anti-sigma factor